tara:strand:+ start:1840 stop:1998 length:159 start_codon:yes stop_codon:yes gene_type:complete
MNKELILEALDTLKTQMKNYMDANDAHYSRFYQGKLSDINAEINKLNTTANG